MTLIIILFVISISLSFGMILFRVWEIRTKRVHLPETNELKIPELPFRRLEKSMLYLTKHIVLGLVLIFVKYWFVFSTKFKKWFDEKWPKINSYFKNKKEKVISYRHSFIKKVILESKVKIRKIRQKVKEENSGEEIKLD